MNVFVWTPRDVFGLVFLCIIALFFVLYSLWWCVGEGINFVRSKICKKVKR